MSLKRGFTLIELLIVVAIIAILAAIAVPNFLEAQIRAKTARVKSDLRTQATAIESYAVDWNQFCRDSDSDFDRELTALTYDRKANGATQLTTPISYITSTLTDPFTPPNTRDVTGGTADGYRIGSGTWAYSQGDEGVADNQDAYNTITAKGKVLAYITLSPGPDKVRNRMAYKCFPFKPVDPSRDNRPSPPNFYEDYDPTNGSISGGDIYRMGGAYMSGDFNRNGPTAGPSGPDQR